MIFDPQEIEELIQLNELFYRIDAQPRGGNRQTEKRFCKLGQLSCFVFELFQSVYRLRPAPSHAGGLRPPWAACVS
jgi:hypothetical protein